MPKSKIIFYIYTIFSFLIVFALIKVKPTYSYTNHVVISEIQISGDGLNPLNDEFVELYNPTNSNVVMSNWRLTRKNSSGTEENLVLTLNGTIPSHGYFLIIDNNGYNGSVSGDVNYSAPSNQMTNNYTILLYSDAGVTLIDKVGFGTSYDPETTSTSNPVSNGSIERKANSSSTSETMTSGNDQYKGNEYDSENNLNDFISRTNSDPQNSSSPTEDPLPATPPQLSETPTPTLEPTLTPTEIPTPSPTMEPTPTSEPSPTPTYEPSPTSTEEPSPSPTEVPTPTSEPSPTPTEVSSPTPTVEPTPSIEPTPSNVPSPTSQPSETPTPSQEPSPNPTIEPTPTSIPSPTPIKNIIGIYHFPGNKIVCTLDIKILHFSFLKMAVPKISCFKI